MQTVKIILIGFIVLTLFVILACVITYLYMNSPTSLNDYMVTFTEGDKSDGYFGNKKYLRIWIEPKMTRLNRLRKYFLKDKREYELSFEFPSENLTDYSILFGVSASQPSEFELSRDGQTTRMVMSTHADKPLNKVFFIYPYIEGVELISIAEKKTFNDSVMQRAYIHEELAYSYS
jgi:hypothetical protein